MENIHVKLFNLDQWFRRRCRLKKKFTQDRQQIKTDYNNSGELKNK